MTNISISDPCILFALRRESLFFRRTFRPRVRFPGAPCRAWFGSTSWLTVLTLETGIGCQAMARALRWALGGPRLGVVTYQPRVVLSVGFSGALEPVLRVGDLVLADEVVDDQGRRWPVTWPGELIPPVANAPGSPTLRRGRLLTVSSLVSTPKEKLNLGQKHRALAVDMETAEVARLCQERQVPFGCLRAISDDLSMPLSPRLLDLLRGGRVLPLRLLAGVAWRPGLLPELVRLADQTRTAARQLAAGLNELLTLTLAP